MEFTDYFRFILVLVFVLGLVFLLAWALKRFGYGGVVGKMQSRRLRVVETALLGPKHRLVLVRRDDVEHLLVLGPNHEAVVETGIRPSVAPLQPAAFAPLLDANMSQADRGEPA
jgi:flagellar protein FliO/FliZ